MTNLGNEYWPAWQAIASEDFSLQPTHPWLKYLDASEDALPRNASTTTSSSMSAAECSSVPPPTMQSDGPDSPQMAGDPTNERGIPQQRWHSKEPPRRDSTTPLRFSNTEKGKERERQAEQEEECLGVTEMPDEERTRGRSRQRETKTSRPKATKSRARSKARSEKPMTDASTEETYDVPCEGCLRRGDACTFRKEGKACGPCNRRKVKCTHVRSTDGRSASRSHRPSPSPASIVGRRRPRPRLPSMDTTPASTPTADAPPSSPRTLRSRALRSRPSTSSDVTPMPPPPKRQRQVKAHEPRATAKKTVTEKPPRSKYEVTPQRCIRNN